MIPCKGTRQLGHGVEQTVLVVDIHPQTAELLCLTEEEVDLPDRKFPAGKLIWLQANQLIDVEVVTVPTRLAMAK